LNKSTYIASKLFTALLPALFGNFLPQNGAEGRAGWALGWDGGIFREED
jgi:hypothetical protein